MNEIDPSLQTLCHSIDAVLVLQVDADNVILAWRDQGVYNGRAFDKYRIGPWFYSNRSNEWLQGKGSVGVPYEQRQGLLAGLTALAGLAALREGNANNLKAMSAAAYARMTGYT
jgi:hypothetical protein